MARKKKLSINDLSAQTKKEKKNTQQYLSIQIHSVHKADSVFRRTFHEEQIACKLLIFKNFNQITDPNFVPLFLHKILDPVVENLHFFRVDLFILFISLPILKKFKQNLNKNQIFS